MADDEQFVIACKHLDLIEACSPEWHLTKAYMRLSQSGKIKLSRFVGGRPTNHENDLPFIYGLQMVRALRFEVTDTINLFPTPISFRVFAEMDRRDDPNNSTAWLYDDNPSMGLI